MVLIQDASASSADNSASLTQQAAPVTQLPQRRKNKNCVMLCVICIRTSSDNEVVTWAGHGLGHININTSISISINIRYSMTNLRINNVI